MATLAKAVSAMCLAVAAGLLVAACASASRPDDILDELTKNQKKSVEKNSEPDDEGNRGRLRFMRLQHSDPKWNRNFGSGGDSNLLAELRTRYPRISAVAKDSESLDYKYLSSYKPTASPPLIYIGGASFKPTAAEKKILRQYIAERGGMILGDSFAKGFGEDFTAVMNEITGARPEEIKRDNPLRNRPYEIAETPFAVAHDGTKASGWKLDDRWVVYFNPGSLSDLWRDDRGGVTKEVAEQGIQQGLNIVSYALREQSKWRAKQQ